MTSTPVVGLGCQSGSYLIYGIVSTLAWALLTFSAFVSHRHALIRQNMNLTARRKAQRLCCFLGPVAVSMRLSGKALAAANTVFLVAISIIQFTGLFDSCWCDACIPSLGEAKGWVILWADDTQIGAASSSAWGGGTLMSFVSMAIVAMVLFILGFERA